MATNNLHDEMQSVYKQYHSAQTALVKVRHDIVHILVSGRCAMLLLLDSSTTSDPINIDKLINKLVLRVNIDGVACDWFRFNLTGRYQRLTIGSSSSNTIPVCHGLPRGGVLRPMMFKAFTTLIADICMTHLVLFPQFNSMLYITLMTSSSMLYITLMTSSSMLYITMMTSSSVIYNYAVSDELSHTKQRLIPCIIEIRA